VLADLARDLSAFRSRLEAAPLSHVRWTPPQDAWLTSTAPRKLLRAGNQLGKTWSAMAEVIYRATGTHPHYRTHAPPVEVWVVCTSWSQSVSIMRKFWDLVPRAAIRLTRFDPRNGFGKDNPAVVFLNGSVVRFRTTNQGPEALAGATIHYVAIDEPCDENIYRELDRRVMRNAGSIGITLTPINRPCGWLRTMVEAGNIVEVHATLTPENLTPHGASGPLRLLDGTPMDQRWIDEQRRITPAMYAPVVLDGEWETRPDGVFFRCFDRARHINANVRLDPQRGVVRWVLGIDYAAADRQYGQVGVLSQVQSYLDDKGRRQELVYVVDMVAMPGIASSEQFAVEVVSLLGRSGIRGQSGCFKVGGEVQPEHLAGHRSRAVDPDLGAGAANPERKGRRAIGWGDGYWVPVHVRGRGRGADHAPSSMRAARKGIRAMGLHARSPVKGRFGRDEVQPERLHFQAWVKRRHGRSVSLT